MKKSVEISPARSRQVASDSFRAFIAAGWAPRHDETPPRSGAADYLAARFQKLGADFLGQRLVIPAGNYKVRSNDCDYRFRAHSAFAHLSGLGAELEPDAVLVLEPLTDQNGDPLPCALKPKETNQATHQGKIFFRPQAPRSSEEFYADTTYGEFWVGPRMTLEQMEQVTGLPAYPLDTLADALAKDAGEIQLRVIKSVDQKLDQLVAQIRTQAGIEVGPEVKHGDERLEAAASTLRLYKDPYEVAELSRAVAHTQAGFEEIIRCLPRAVAHHRGERVVEGAFMARAREEGNGLGYETIAAAGNHANTLHWIDNNGPVRSGDLILVDAGVEVDSLYTADITRTLPVNGRFTPVQAQVYQAVLDACEAGLAQARQPGCRFRDIHDAAVAKLVDYLDLWGLLPVSKTQALSAEGQEFRRWMPHGVSHHLGLDVHDCAQASRDMYLEAPLEPGMCFTIEPGLYFHADDQLIPEDFRGIGVRIEDDVVMDPDGSVRRISEDIPRRIPEVEAWMQRIWNQMH